MRRIVRCGGCGKEKEHHAKEKCFNCYRKQAWIPKTRVCIKCNKNRPHQAKGLCPRCYTKTFGYSHIKRYNARRYHNLSLEAYKQVTKRCVICGFDNVVDLHHIDGNHKNNHPSNFTGLCPNHHKMYHAEEFKEEIVKILKEKGYG